MADTIVITEQVTVLEIDDSTVEVIEVAQQGPAGTPGAQGPVGPQGPKGDAGSPATNLVSSVAGRTGAVTLSKGDVGLETVDNTSDADKPLSTAAKTALGLKADDASVLHKSGDELVSGVKTFATSPVVPIPTTGGQAAPKSYVDSAASSVNNFSGSTPANNTSLDTLATPGVYRITWGATVAQGAPFENFYGTLEVLPRAGGAMTQIAYKHNALSADSGQYWQRTQTGAGWGTWFTYSSSRATSAGEVFLRTGLTTEAQIPVVGVSLSTSDLNSVVVTGTYVQATGANATLARNYPKANVGAVLEVVSLFAGTTVQRLYIAYGSGPNVGVGHYERRQTGGTWDEWVFFARRRWDQTAGRTAYEYNPLTDSEQLIYGDTGRRDITALFGASVTAGTVLIQRNGRNVTITLNNVTVPSGAPTVTGIIAPGFRITGAGVYAVGYSPNTATVWSDGNINLPTGSGRYGSFTYLTEQAWPTSLPGTADGSIPSA